MPSCEMELDFFQKHFPANNLYGGQSVANIIALSYCICKIIFASDLMRVEQFLYLTANLSSTKIKDRKSIISA